ncbi:hypothetical protein GW626_18730 [Peribacillus muralis]|uniref:sigma 54-interacting transcriptional regulator n=1 Tax=Peribacillus muralis TaxID=264697 RepID=UPI001F4DD272|nr:sigma 54-interacting transcriptional regulator [Peribacillus muralis]MCK1995147.1 sigma 54-interacting transcriptional regulator [Peribacillus muralis]MCK2015770.1 sigma 54-interacting transcriptional regulator [Peribacillus muralis]
MIKIGVMGSLYFKYYVEDIQRAQTFEDVELVSYLTTDEMNYTAMAKKVETEHCQALVMGAGDYMRFSAYTKIPCYIVQPDLLDFLTLHNKIHDYEKMAVVFHHPEDMNFSILEASLNVRYQKFYYNDVVQLDELLRQLKQDGFTTIIGNNFCKTRAQQANFTSHYYYGQETITKAISNAIQVIRNLRQEELHNNEIHSILENNISGVISASGPMATINYINKTALNILRLQWEDLYQKPLSEFVAPELAKHVLNNSGVPLTEIQFNLCGVDVIGNIVPFELQDQKKSICLLFENTSRILKYETMIQQEVKRKSFSTHYTFHDIIGTSSVVKEGIARAKNFAQSKSTILINAETGAGKEVFAQSIHDYSPRKQYPFVAINCGSIPDALIESELFGYESGAFTGANAKGKRGLIELANHGTVFLDDIDSISLNFQAKLLRVIQEREIIHVGGSSTIPVDVRFIVATNRDLRKMVADGEFRNDLYYRLNVLRLHIPPLRERKEDIPALYEYYLQHFSTRIYKQIQPYFQQVFQPAFTHAYPGNIRELISVAERFVTLADTKRLTDKEYLKRQVTACLDIDEQYTQSGEHLNIPVYGNYNTDLQNAEQVVLEYYFKKHDGSMTSLAKQLGVSRATLYNKLRKL